MKTNAAPVNCLETMDTTLEGSYSTTDTPEHVELLSKEDRDALGVDGRAAWPDLKPVQRERLLEKSRLKLQTESERLKNRQERERLCGEYVATLTEVGRLKGEEREEARLRLDVARAAWYAVRKRRK